MINIHQIQILAHLALVHYIELDRVSFKDMFLVFYIGDFKTMSFSQRHKLVSISV